jgi:hypothetical protein
MRYISWFGYANEAIVTNQWRGVDNIECDQFNPNCFRRGSDVIEFLKMKEVSTNRTEQFQFTLNYYLSYSTSSS